MKRLVSFLLVLALCATALASCGGGDDTDALKKASEFLFSKYKNISVTATDYDLVNSVTIDNVKYTVEWTVDVKSGSADGVKVVPGDGVVTIDVDEKAVSQIDYALKGTVKDADGKTSDITLNCSVPEFKMLSWEDYLAAEEGASVAVKGVVTAVIAKSKGNSSNCLYIQGDNCGFYVYGMATDPASENGIEVGMTVSATGIKKLYNGTLEITEAAVEILDAAKKDLAPVDYTELYANASALDDKALTEKQSMLVTVKGVEITGEDAGSGYYKFKLNDKESYIRISSSVCPLSKDEQDAFKKAHNDHFGWIGDATGVICIFNGAFYLTPVTLDGFTYTSLPEKSDEEMADFEVKSISIEQEYFKNAELDVPVKGQTYEQVSIEWSSDNDAIKFENGKMIVTIPETDTTVKVTAVAKCGGAEMAVEFGVKLNAHELTEAEILEKAFALGVGEILNGTFTLTGEITAIPTAYSEQYGNITVNIKVGDKEIQCFRLKGEGAETLAVGNVITVTGVLKNYNGTIEFDKDCTFVFAGSEPSEPDESAEPVSQVSGDVEAILEAVFALAEGDMYADEVTLTGDVTAIVTPYNAQYENVTFNLKVGEKTIQCFRVKGEDAPTVGKGDVVTVTGKIKNYSGTIEFDAGSTFVTVSKGEAEKLPETEEEILAAAFALEENTALTGVYTLTGVVTEIVTEFNESYGNVSVNIQIDDKTIQCYRMVASSADDVKVGDYIAVTGSIKNYKGIVEFDAGCTFKPDYPDDAD